MAGPLLRGTRARVVVAAAMAVLPLLSVAQAVAQQASPGLSANVSVFATGFNGPRGLRFGPDGNLYVAEAGTGGNRTTVGLTMSAAGPCQQAGPQPGPYHGDYTARISMVDAKGNRSTVVDGLPSAINRLGGILGVADVEFVNGVLYGLLEGAGCSHGIQDVPNGVIQVSFGGTWSEYNLSAWVHAHPVANPDADDFEPDGSWYSMTTANGNIYALDANRGELVKIDPVTSVISRVVDISASMGHIVPTAVAYHDGAFYVGNLGEFPQTPGSDKVLKIGLDGSISTYATGLTHVVSLAFDKVGNLYATEILTTPAPGPQAAGTGMVVRVSTTGAPTPVATGLTFPAGMTFGPDGMLYVSNNGAFLPAGTGQIVRVNVNAPLS